jgi:phage-related protein
MTRSIIFHKNHFIEFYQNLDIKAKNKVQYVLELIKQVERVPDKFLKHLEGTNGLYEIRIEYQSNIYRIFCCFDEGKLVILFNGFQKKSQKTPKKEIEKAERLMKDYFELKKMRDEGL